MPHIDFSSIDDLDEMLPEGQYRLQVVDIEESETRNGDPMWALTHRVLGGKYEGRRVRDNLVFSRRAYPRVKRVCSQLGIDVTGTVDLTPEMLLDRSFLASVKIDQYEDANGNERKVNGIAFDGYARDPGEGWRDGDDEQVPF